MTKDIYVCRQSILDMLRTQGLAYLKEVRKQIENYDSDFFCVVFAEDDRGTYLYHITDEVSPESYWSSWFNTKSSYLKELDEAIEYAKSTLF